MAMGVAPAPFRMAEDQGFDDNRDGLGVGKLFSDIKVRVGGSGPTFLTIFVLL